MSLFCVPRLCRCTGGGTTGFVPPLLTRALYPDPYTPPGQPREAVGESVPEQAEATPCLAMALPAPPASGAIGADAVSDKPAAVIPLATPQHVPSSRWSVDLGTGLAITVDSVLVRNVHQAAELMASFAPLLRGGRSIAGLPSIADITQKLDTLEQVFNPRTNEEAANRLCADWADFPPEVVSRDRDSLARLGSLAAVIAEKHAITAATGFNVDRVRAHISPECPQYDALVQLATHGADIVCRPIVCSHHLTPETTQQPKSVVECVSLPCPQVVGVEQGGTHPQR